MVGGRNRRTSTNAREHYIGDWVVECKGKVFWEIGCGVKGKSQIPKSQIPKKFQISNVKPLADS